MRALLYGLDLILCGVMVRAAWVTSDRSKEMPEAVTADEAGQLISPAKTNHV